MNKAKPCGCKRERESLLFSEQIGAKGGSREQLEVSILPRDFE